MCAALNKLLFIFASHLGKLCEFEHRDVNTRDVALFVAPLSA